MGLSFDVGIIGAGIQGVGVAQAAAASGYSVVIWEQTGVASATSSRSSKLIHGGLRYLESGQFALVRKSLRERALLLENAPELVRTVPFYIPIYAGTQRRSWQIRLGLSLYALLGGLKPCNRFRKVRGKQEIAQDGIKSDRLQNMYQYWDAQTDDAALTAAVLHSAEALGAEYYCPAEVTSVMRSDEGYRVQAGASGEQREYHCRTVVNAAGPWVNHMAGRVEPPVTVLDIDLVQGTHIVVDDEAPKGLYYVEAPQDRRAVFVMPWQGKTMIGTTEVRFSGEDPGEVAPTRSEIDYLLAIYRNYFPSRRGRVINAFAGLRVLPRQEGHFFHRPRDTVIHADPAHPGLLTLYGGKLTGYRALAEDVVGQLKVFLPRKKQKLETSRLHLTAKLR